MPHCITACGLTLLYQERMPLGGEPVNCSQCCLVIKEFLLKEKGERWNRG